MLTDDDKLWIAERLRELETRLLTEFHKWASPAELRVRSHSAVLCAVDAEMETIPQRLTTSQAAVQEAMARIARLEEAPGSQGILHRDPQIALDAMTGAVAILAACSSLLYKG